MRFSTTLATLVAALSAHVSAQGVNVVQPAAGASLAAGLATLTLQDSGVTPALALLSAADILLMVGGNTEGTDAKNLGSVGTLTYPAITIPLTISATLSSTLTNGFYLKIVSNIKEGGTVINYSKRFSITGMTGTLDAIYKTGATTAGSAVPAVVVQAAAAAAGASVASGVDQFTVPYNQQVGLTKYAPMQPIPPTRISKGGNPTPLYPTSSYVVAKTFLPRATIATTLTAQQTFSVDSIENPAAAQSLPTGDMAKFLARWKD